MNAWYYSDQGQQRGPVDEAALAELRRRGTIHEQTLVWRKGMTDWQPLGLCLDALAVSDPPPSPFAPPRAPVYEAPVGAPITGGPVVYGGFWRRWVALIVDTIALYLPMMVMAAIAVPIVGQGLSEDAAGAVLYVLWLITAPIYYASLESSAWQATLGKRLLGIKVVDLEGGRISFGRALGRWFAAVLSYVTFYIGFLLAAFTERKQALHDFMAGTLVVDRWAFTDSPEKQTQRLPVIAIVVIAAVVMIVPIAILAAIAIPAYNDYLVRAKTAEVLASTSMAKTAVAEFVVSESTCPRDWSDLPSAARPTSPLIGESTVGEFDGGGCGIQLIFADSSPRQLAGNQLTLSYDADSMAWRCSSNVVDRYLPTSCRG